MKGFQEAENFGGCAFRDGNLMTDKDGLGMDGNESAFRARMG